MILGRPVSLLTNCLFTATRDKDALHVIDQIFQMKVSLLEKESGTNLSQLFSTSFTLILFKLGLDPR